MNRAESDEEKFSREFKAQLSQRVLTKIEKRYSQCGELNEAEITCFKEAEQAVKLA